MPKKISKEYKDVSGAKNVPADIAFYLWAETDNLLGFIEKNRLTGTFKFESSTEEATGHFKDGLLHREDGPAYHIPGVLRLWFRNGLLHREGGKPALDAPINNQRHCYENGIRTKQRKQPTSGSSPVEDTP